MKVCAESGCPELTPSTRCPDHTRAKDRARGTRQQRGYDAKHVALRVDYQNSMNAGQTYNCWRCGAPIDPRRWDLGHVDGDKTRYMGPECRSCNRSTASRRP